MFGVDELLLRDVGQDVSEICCAVLRGQERSRGRPCEVVIVDAEYGDTASTGLFSPRVNVQTSSHLKVLKYLNFL